MNKLTVAVIQICAGPEKEQNLAKAERLVEQSVTGGGARFVALPEVFSWRGPPADEAAAAEPLDGPVVTHMAQVARRLGVWLLLGSMLERDAAGGLPFNTSVLLDPQGKILTTYRKIHLFDVNIPGTTVQESATRTPGSGAVTAHLGDDGDVHPLCLGLSVCYDLRFPELYRQLMRNGAHVLCVPAAFTARTGRDHWLTLLTARAIENLSFVIAPNQWGVGGDRIDTYGRSAIIDPWGTLLCSCPDGEGWASAVVDLDRQQEIRARLPALTHIRSDLFFGK